MPPLKLMLLTAIMLTGIVIGFCLLKLHSDPPHALAVSFIGYTNLPSGRRAAAFTVSNECNITVKRWGVAYLEPSPFADHFTTNWIMEMGHPDIYLKPKAAEQLIVRQMPPSGEWRLRVPWSSGVRARIHLALRRFPYSKLPGRWSVAPEYYATSDTVR
jgi:hypothetical protein